MGLFDKVKKAISGGTPPPSKQGGGQRSGGSQGGQGGRGSGGQGGGRQGGGRQGGQGGGQAGQGGQGGGTRSQGGNRNRPGSERDGSGAGSGTGGNRRRGSRGGRGRSGAGGNSHAQGGQGGQRQGGDQQQRPESQQGAGSATQPRDGQDRGNGEAGSSSSSRRRRRRGGRGRGGSGGAGGEGGGQGGTTRTVTRSNAAELKEQQEQGGGRDGGGRQGGQRSGSGKRSRSGGGNGGGGKSRSRSGGGRRRERTRRGSASSGSQRRVLDANERPKDPVKKQILINASDPNEIRVAIREQQKVVEVYVERKGKRSLAGNIYKGRVQNVLRGMEAAFVDIGLERNGFLYVDEITPAAADSDQIMKVSMVTEMEANTAAETPTASAITDDGRVMTVEAPGTPAEAMAKAASDNDETLDIDDAMEEEDREAAEAAAEAEAASEDKDKEDKPKGRGRARIQNKKKIQDLLKPGQEILCQVVKDPMGTKGSRLTTQYSLAGRYLVYVPDGEGLGVSRRLEEAERNRLRDIVKQFELPWGGGLIVRTAAEGALEEDIAKDLQLLLRLHEQLMDKAGQARAPKLLYNEADLSLRIIRDLMNDEVEEVLVDDDRQYQRIMNYLKRTSPILAERVRMHDGQRPIFESYGVEEAIRSTISKRADLPSGGYLILDKTEAFHVIDVNTGRNVGTASLEETITKTNMEAAEEVVRQLRLRDLGGIIVVDFIDMNLMKNRDAVLEHFRKELSKDRTKTYLVEISPLGLVEMTRQNVSEGVREILTSTCRTCEGKGVVLSAETHAIEVERAVVELAGGLGEDVEAMAIEAQPEVARVLAGNQGKQGDLDRRAGKVVRVFPDPDLSPNTFALRAKGSSAEVQALAEPLLRGTKHKVMIDRVDPTSEDDGLAVVDGVLVTVIGAGSLVGEERTIMIAACAGGRAFATLVKPARRRRRRGGRGRRKAAVAAGAVGADGTSADEGDDLDDEGDDFDDDEEGDDDGDFDGDDEEDDDDAPASDEDDERTEIPQRLVMLGDDRDGDDDDDDDDDDEDDDRDADDHEDDSGDEEGEDGSGEEDDQSDDDGSDDDPDDDGPDGSGGSDSDSASRSDDEAVDDEDAVADEDSSIDAGSVAADDRDERPLARRLPQDDHDEPSIDAEGDDDLLEARGVSTPSDPAPDSSGSSGGAGSSGPERSSTAGEGQGAAGQRRRRRGSRGGRNRNRSGSGASGGGGGARAQGGGSGGGSSSDA